MKVKNVVAGAARLILRGELADKIENGTTLTTEEQNEVNQLIRAYNLTLNEVATEYLSLTAEEMLLGKEILFSSLNHPPLKIVSVTDARGEKVAFTVLADRIKLYKFGKYTVRYDYIPQNKVLTDDFDYEKSKVGERAFIYGVASEFCIMAGRYEEAANYRSKFEKAATSPLSRGGKKIKGRIWG